MPRLPVTRSFFHEVAESLRTPLYGFRGLALVGLDGNVLEQATNDFSVGPETLSEFATLLRIAQHTAEDTAAGPLLETSWTTEGILVLAHRVSAESFLILVCRPDERTGFARYLLRRAAWRLRPQLHSASR